MPVNFSKNISMSLRPQDRPYRNSLFEVGLLIIISGLFFWFIVLPKKAEVDLKINDLATIQQRGSQASGQLDELKNLIGSLPSNTQNTAILDQAIPLDGNVIKLQLLIQSIAQSAGVTLGNVSISGNPNGAIAGDTALLANPYGVARKLKTLDGALYVIGSFNQLQALLQKLESSGRLIDIDNLAISQGSEGNLGLSINFKAYYFGP
jgi:Tfp pilus assembly protein PilO